MNINSLFGKTPIPGRTQVGICTVIVADHGEDNKNNVELNIETHIYHKGILSFLMGCGNAHSIRLITYKDNKLVHSTMIINEKNKDHITIEDLLNRIHYHNDMVEVILKKVNL